MSNGKMSLLSNLRAFTCLTCLLDFLFYVPTCLLDFLFYVPACLLDFLFYVPACLLDFLFYVPTCLLHYVRAFVFYMPTCLRAICFTVRKRQGDAGKAGTQARRHIKDKGTYALKNKGK